LPLTGEIADKLAAFWVRKAMAADEPVIRGMVHSARINPTGLRWQHFIVAVRGEHEIIGCGQVKPHRDGSLELASIVVRRQWRGRGVARRLIEELKTNSGPPLWLTCASSLGRFYDKFGFSETAPADHVPRIVRLGLRVFNLLPGLSRRKWRIITMVWAGS
jgi:N-acetylglutamate synthase-like GNAT family acetyltransferase